MSAQTAHHSIKNKYNIQYLATPNVNASITSIQN